jgi:hypothetical protein
MDGWLDLNVVESWAKMEMHCHSEQQFVLILSFSAQCPFVHLL